LDEADHQPGPIVNGLVAGAAAMTIGLLIAWRSRPRPRGRLPRAAGRRRKRIWIGFALAGAVTVVSPPLGVATALGPILCRRWSTARRSARATRQISTDFPDAIDLLVLSIRAGYLPAQAIVEIVPYLPTVLRAPFGAVGDAMRCGRRFGDALDQLSDRLGPIARPLVDSLSAADRYGLPLSPVLERLSLEARQQRRRDTDAAARELPVRLAVPLVLCTLPSFVLLAIVPLLLGALSSLRT
jgi:tight adherence protein C